jgi:outer membrane receptor protein involved in Fe transport
LGPGRNRQFIRGVADSPFNGNSQSTVAILVNDARATYNAPDPDLRLVDVERVELLKGPQGSLYGTGTLGGVFHIVTRPPDPAGFAAMAGVGGSLATHGEAGASADAMVNLPLAEGLALRAVAYAAREPGWIDTAGRGDANRGEVKGARVALRALPGDWTIDLNGVLQNQDVADSQYVFARHRLDRPAQPAEPHDNDFTMAALRVAGRLGDADLVYAGNWVDHDVSSTLDASALSASAFGVPAPALYVEQRRNHLFDQEVRLSRTVEGGLSWLAGLSFMDVRNHLLGTIQSADRPDLTVATGIQQVTEFSAFGDLRLPLSDAISLSVGGRLFHSRIEEERGAKRARVRSSVSRSGLTPSLALSAQAGKGDFLYLRYAGALRPGGLSQTATGSAERFRSDELQTLEAGWRHGPSGRFTFNAGSFLTFWSHLQSDYLLADGLIGTRNVGDARIYGMELSADWTPARSLTLTAGLVAQSALLTRTSDGAKIGEDRHLPVIPGWTARLGLDRRFTLLGWEGSAGARIHYLGRSRLSFDPGLDRKMGDYALADADLILRKSAWSLRLSATNLLDSKADSFAFGNPFSLGNGPQYTPLRPRQWALTVTKALSR